MALIFAAIAAAGALSGAAHAQAADTDPNQAQRPDACRAMRVTARADLVYKPDAETPPSEEKVVVMVEQTRRTSELSGGETGADKTHADAEPARLLICGPRRGDRDPDA